MALFGGDQHSEEMKKISENMANLSNQIGSLQSQLKDKNAQVDALQQQLAQVQSAASGDDATKQVSGLQSQLAAAQADKQAADTMLETAHKQVAELQAQLANLTQAASGGLAVGASAWVTREGGLPLRLRSGPGLQNSVLGQLQPGTKLALLAGPQPEDGYSWWHIRAEDGREGWVAGNDLRTQPD